MSLLQDQVNRLCDWYKKNLRPLPWRKTHDPYRIWISEIMLQQTQVNTVIPYYEKFISSFPELKDLANAKEETVLEYWSGLGYYSRAKNLHKGALSACEKWGGQLPSTVEELLTIPGIGRYTAGAICSIAFDQPAPIVDGNIQRVFSRLFAIESAGVPKVFWETAQTWVRKATSPRILNQALMELGAMICVKGRPRCDQCPLSWSCIAYQTGRTEELPLKPKQEKKISLYWQTFLFETNNKLFLVQNRRSVSKPRLKPVTSSQRPDADWWKDMWDFPRKELSKHDWSKTPTFCKEDLPCCPLPQIKHSVTRYQLFVQPYIIRASHRQTRPLLKAKRGKWLSPGQLQQAAISSLARKVLNAYLATTQACAKI